MRSVPATLQPASIILSTTRDPAAARPFILWHLLSLDAPTVAVLWTWFIARASHIALPIPSLAALFLAVWILYAADRLLDARLLDHRPQRAALASLEPRHLFHHRHRQHFLTGIALAAIALAALLPRLNPAAIRLYLAEAALLAAWFLILHATRSAHRLPKEIAVGLFFSAAIFIPTVARQPAERLALLPLAALFATLCSLNCLFIYAWEHDRIASAPIAHLTTRLALRHLIPLTRATAAMGATLALLGPLLTIPLACILASVSLLLLHRSRHRLAPTLLRACADLALLTPLLLLPFTQ